MDPRLINNQWWGDCPHCQASDECMTTFIKEYNFKTSYWIRCLNCDYHDKWYDAYPPPHEWVERKSEEIEDSEILQTIYLDELR